MRGRVGNRGFSMIELLVAVLVMSVGVLGVAGLATLNAQHQRSAAAHAEAVRLAYDLMDRIRANPAGLRQGSYASGDEALEAPDCRAGQCAAAQMAAFDLAQWRCALGAATAEDRCRAPINAVGTVAADAATGRVRITIRWRDQGESRTLTIDSQA